MNHYIAIAVTTDKPSRSTLTGLNRAQKLAALQRCTRERADEIVRWLDDQHLSDQVGQVVSDNAMNVVFMETTPEVKRRLQDAPHVTGVATIERIPVELAKQR